MAQNIDNKKLSQLNITVVPDDQMRNYHNDPTIKARTEKARAFLEKVGLPKGWDKKKEH